MPDFFISYTSADKDWAEWIGYVLEEEGLTVTIQAWDFRPGSNFVLEMQKAAAEAARTILVLSPAYMKSQFASSEWAAAFVQDPQGFERRLLPIMVRDCQVTGLLKALVHINLSTVDEFMARQLLIDGLNDKRAKPPFRPTVPGANPRQPRSFPGAQQSIGASASQTYIPSIERTPSDVEKRRFAKGAFETIKAHFESGLTELARRNGHVLEIDMQANSGAQFTAEIFLQGKSKCYCRIWQGGLHSADGISYSETQRHFGGNACNEILTLGNAKSELYLVSLMGAGFARIDPQIDLKRMSVNQAADYLWRRFVEPLERR